MKFEFESEGGRLHWVVRCIEHGKVAELHRFYRTPDNFIYHRGKHGVHEVEAQRALTEYLGAHPELFAGIEKLNPGENSTMHVRQLAAGGSKRGD